MSPRPSSAHLVTSCLTALFHRPAAFPHPSPCSAPHPFPPPRPFPANPPLPARLLMASFGADRAVIRVSKAQGVPTIVLLLRLVPILPFNVMNYVLSVTPISLSSYVLASWIGMMVGAGMCNA
ncbi:unnamed protein product [Closterium sp. NIES-53]